jgi:signal transduction histidine kinase
MKHSIIAIAVSLLFIAAQGLSAQQTPGIIHPTSDDYEYAETRDLVELVKDAAELLRSKGEEAFTDFRLPGSRWRQEETYIFVLDPEGKMLVHPDATMEGKNQLNLKDINGKPIIRGLIAAVTTFTSKPEGWYHYEWPVPGGLLPRWKSSYVRLVMAPSGARFIVGSGMYNDRMERSFVIDQVKDAVGQIEQNGEAAFQLFHDRTGPFIAKDAYIFVIDEFGIDLVNPAFPNLEGRNILDVKDTQGKYLIQEMLKIAQTTGSGWVDYMWPKPGESVSTRKSAYVRRAQLGEMWVVVGCGVYLADASKAVATEKMTAPELMTLVRDAAAVFEERGDKAFPEFRKRGSRWFRDDTYFFAWTLDGIRIFHAADPGKEGRKDIDIKDVLGRPYGRMFLEAAGGATGEGWVHYMYPEPGDIFPTWKSVFVKRVTFPSGKQHVIGCGIYNMEMDKAFIEDVVNRAAALVADRGKGAFDPLRDRTGPFFFMDTYVFVETPDGTEFVNPGQPSLEGKNLIEVRDVKGKPMVRDFISAAMKDGSAWVDYYWYKPGHNTPARKHTYVRKVQASDGTYIVGSGFYPRDEAVGSRPSAEHLTTAEQRKTDMSDVRKFSWNTIKKEKISDRLSLQKIFGEKGTLAQYSATCGDVAARHFHANEEYMWITSGALKYIFGDREVVVNVGEVLVIPPNVPHSIVAMEDTVCVGFFAPAREDWLRGEDQYLRK